MEKIININFQGRVIPIEETAYNNLKQYIDGLRRHFAAEESNDEIINDIENRIAELLSDRLKQGTVCINSSDLDKVIDNIGRIEDIEAAEGEEQRPPKQQARQPQGAPVKGRFFRNADDKVIAGVCSGIASRTGLDPVVVRVLFVVLCGALFWLYILLWIIVPSQSVQSNITRRLYRNPDDKVIAGVCGGLAVYFNTAAWIPRLIFALPFFIGIFSRSIHAIWWDWQWGWGPQVFTGSFGGTLFVLYVILWIALPFANTATAKMEMRGEKIDLNSIKANAGTATYERHRSGLGRVIGILFKAFFLFIAGVFALSLFCALVGLAISGFVAIPFTNFFLDNMTQYALAWSGIILFLGIPFLALCTWIVRRMMGVRSHRHYLGYVFSGLWFTGLVCLVILAGLLTSDFSSRSAVEEVYPLSQPSVGKLYVNIGNKKGLYGPGDHTPWFTHHYDNDEPSNVVSRDSLWLNTVRVKVAQSPDSLYHLYETRISRGNSQADAKNLAGHIVFNISQQDSIINLPRGFSISKQDKFRNQQVVIVVEVPMGKHIAFSKGIDAYRWFNINIDGHRGNYYYERDWDNSDDYNDNSEYLMTPSGLKDTRPDTVDTGDDEEDD